MLSGKTTKSTRTNATNLTLSYVQREAAQYSGARQETVKSPATAWRYQEILSAKQAVVGFRRKPDT